MGYLWVNDCIPFWFRLLVLYSLGNITVYWFRNGIENGDYNIVEGSGSGCKVGLMFRV